MTPEPHDGCAERACECVVRERDEARAEVERLRLALREARDAIRFTQEYIGNDLLPPIEGWSWFDGLAAIDAALQTEGTARRSGDDA